VQTVDGVDELEWATICGVIIGAAGTRLKQRRLPDWAFANRNADHVISLIRPRICHLPTSRSVME